MRREGDGSQLHSLPSDTGAIAPPGDAPPGSSRPGTAVFQKTPPQERRRDLPSDASPKAFPSASLQRSCLMMSEGEKGARGQEKRKAAPLRLLCRLPRRSQNAQPP